MKKLFFVIIFLLSFSGFAQNSKKTYTLHLGEKDNDTLVYEMELYDNFTFVNRKYSKKISDNTNDYKNWMVEIRKGTFKKEKGFFRLTQIDGDQSMNDGLIKIVFRQIWFYSCPDEKGKVRHCRSITYHRVD
jgi:hypothetical protein